MALFTWDPEATREVIKLFAAYLKEAKAQPRHKQYEHMIGVAYGVRVMTQVINHFSHPATDEEGMYIDSDEIISAYLDIPNAHELQVMEDEWRQGK